MPKGQTRRYNIGGQMMTIPQIAKQPWCKLKASTIQRRVRNGMHIVDAVTTKPWQTYKKYIYKGRRRSLSYLANLPECRVSKSCLYLRLEKYDWPSVELAVTMPALTRSASASKEWQRKKIIATPFEESRSRAMKREYL